MDAQGFNMIKNRNVYRGYFPNDVNGKEGLDIGDPEVTNKYASKINKKYIEYLDLNKSLDKRSIKILSKYFDKIFRLGEILFKSVIKIYGKDINKSALVFSRLKTLHLRREREKDAPPQQPTF